MFIRTGSCNWSCTCVQGSSSNGNAQECERVWKWNSGYVTTREDQSEAVDCFCQQSTAKRSPVVCVCASIYLWQYIFRRQRERERERRATLRASIEFPAFAPASIRECNYFYLRVQSLFPRQTGQGKTQKEMNFANRPAFLSCFIQFSRVSDEKLRRKRERERIYNFHTAFNIN